MTFKLVKRIGILFLLVVVLVYPLWPGPSRAGDNIWTTTGPYGVYVYDIVIDPSNASRLYAGTGGTVPVYRSLDGGQSWQPASTGLPSGQIAGNELAFDPLSPQTLYVATDQGLYSSNDGAMTWGLKANMAVRSIAVSPLGDKIYAVGVTGLHVSSDGGDSFERIEDGTIAGEMAFLRIAPSAPHILYLAGNFDGLYNSTDGGQSWDRADSAWGFPPQFLDVAIDPHSAATVYVSVAGTGLFRTTNGGATWAPMASADLKSTYIADIVIDPGNQQVIYAAGGAGFASATPGVYRSLNNLGLAWEHLVDGMGIQSVQSLAINHQDPRILYAGTGSGIWSYRLISGPEDYSVSINDGALFTNRTAVTLTLTVPSSGDPAMLLSNDGGFGGASWEAYTSPKAWQITAHGESVVPRTVYARFQTGGQNSGLYLDDIILDTTPPAGSIEITGPSLALIAPPAGSSLPDANGASQLSWTRAASNTVYLPMVVKNENPGLLYAKLLLVASDDVSGVESMVVGLKPDLADGQWQPYAESKTMWLPRSGSVSVQYRDRAGNVSPVYSVEVP